MVSIWSAPLVKHQIACALPEARNFSCTAGLPLYRTVPLPFIAKASCPGPSRPTMYYTTREYLLGSVVGWSAEIFRFQTHWAIRRRGRGCLENRPPGLGGRPGVSHSLKVVVAFSAVVAAGGEAAVFETASRSRRGRGRCGRVFRSAPCGRPRCGGHA